MWVRVPPPLLTKTIDLQEVCTNTSEDKKGSEIYVMNSDGSGLTKMTDDPAYDAFPTWRPRLR